MSSLAYRAPMRSRDDDVPRYAGVERALRLGRCGVGGRLDSPPSDLDEAVFAVAHEHDARTAARLRRFAQVPDGAEVWTRDESGLFHRGALAGPWTYDEDGYDADLCHVRATRWEPVEDPAVPDGVREAFARGGRNFQGIRASRPSAGT